MHIISIQASLTFTLHPPPPTTAMQSIHHLSEMGLSLTPTGPTCLLLSNLANQLSGDPLLTSHLWKSLHNSSPPPRTAMPSGWSSYSEVIQEQCPFARTALACLDVLQSFTRNSPHHEKIHISAFLTIHDLQSGQQGTSGGTSLSIHKPLPSDHSAPQQSVESNNSNSIDSIQDLAYSQSASFIVDMKQLKELHVQNNEDPDFAATIVIDINVMEDLRFERSTEDNHEAIALAIITGYFLLRMAGVQSDGSFVKVQREYPMALSDQPSGRILISARWPDLPPSVLKMAHSLRQSWKGTSEDFVKLRNVVDNITVQDGRRNIVLLGRTGSGKSYTGNWILRQVCDDDTVRFMESESGSMTSFVEHLPTAGCFCVWDTPGLDDAYGRDKRYLDDIEKSILEMGTVSVIILCLANIERIERSVQHQIASYAKIIGPELSSRMMLFVNRQTRNVTSIQKKNLITAMQREGGLTIKPEQIFDMGSHTQNIDGSMYQACQVLLQMCSKPGMKMSYVDRLQQGLLQIQSLQGVNMRTEAENMLVKMSSELLWLKFGDEQRTRPLKLQPSAGKAIVLSDRCRYVINNEKVMIEHVLEMPTEAQSMFHGLTAFLQGFGSRNQHVLRLVELAKRLRLVFMEMPSDRKFERGGLIRKVLKIRYRLWNVSDALAEDVKQHIQKAAGLAGETSVSAFPALRMNGVT